MVRDGVSAVGIGELETVTVTTNVSASRDCYCHHGFPTMAGQMVNEHPFFTVMVRAPAAVTNKEATIEDFMMMTRLIAVLEELLGLGGERHV